MDPVVLEASVRTETGKKAGKAFRRAGRIPAVVYGEGQAPTPIVLGEKALARILQTAAGENVLITLTLAPAGGGAAPSARTVLIKEIQQHPISTKILHVDFHQVSLTKRIQVTVAVHLTGEPIGVRQDGGRLDHLLWEVRVDCLPTEIPKRLEADVSALKIGDSVLIQDLQVPAGVKILQDPQVAVAACLPPVVEQAPEAAAAEAAAAAEPEVIKQKKPEAEAGDAAAGAKPEKSEKAEKPEKPEKKA